MPRDDLYDRHAGAARSVEGARDGPPNPGGTVRCDKRCQSTVVVVIALLVRIHSNAWPSTRRARREFEAAVRITSANGTRLVALAAFAETDETGDRRWPSSEPFPSQPHVCRRGRCSS